MSDLINPAPPSADSVLRAVLDGLKQLTLMIYILHVLSFFTGGLTGIVAIIMNYLKRDDVKGTVYESHFTWQIRTFWWTLLWSFIGFLALFVFVGFFVLFALFIWWLYRMIKGILNWTDGKPMPL